MQRTISCSTGMDCAGCLAQGHLSSKGRLADNCGLKQQVLYLKSGQDTTPSFSSWPVATFMSWFFSVHGH